MQSAGGGGPSRVGPAGRAASTSSAASPSSSSSAVSTPQLGFDSVQQQQQQQQMGSRQVLPHQLLRKPEGNETLLAYQASAFQGAMGGNSFASSSGSMQMPQQSRKFFDLAQYHGSSQDGQNRNQAAEQVVLNPAHQAYLQFACQQQKPALAMQAQQAAKMGILGPATSKDQDMRMGNLKMQEVMSMQAANQAQASSSKISSESFSRGEKLVEQAQQLASDQRNEQKPPSQAPVIGQLMPSNVIRHMQAPQAQQSIQNMANNQLAMAAQLQAMQAWALERNIDLSVPANANLMAQLIPLMQSRMAAQQKPCETSAGLQASSVPVSMSKHQVASPSVASESSPRANSSSDASGQSGPPKVRQNASSVPFIPSSSAGMVNSTNNPSGQQFAFHSRENQVPPRTGVVLGNGMSPMLPPQQSANVSQGADQTFPTKNALGSPENLQMQHLKQLNRSSLQPAGPSNDGGSSSHLPLQGGPAIQVAQPRVGFTKQQLHVLKAQILAFRRLKGLSDEEIRAAAACAGEEVMIRNRFMEMNAPRDGSSVSKYYHLAHAVNERVIRQPSMLRAGTLRDYQLVGLQWMLSLYNNKLNGILADEMGLGKTVQVMALIAYLMEFKGNYGPHLIIVPNAVLVNWKSELHNWLPSVSCIYYVGGKDQRSKLFSQEVSAMKFNVLVTTYEFIMYDRSKLSKVEWKYIIIDEAQRMKDRESVLARDLDRYRCQRRLLLTGTPLQNDLKELWSLLNLLLPEVFDNRKAFHDWFSKPFQKEGPAHDAEDDWLETEKKVIIIHRLHQILEPFMLRRRVEDVEGSLPPKVSIVLRCRMSAIQSAIYDWIKSTGTLRVDPEDEKRRVQKNPIYQPKVYKTLNNRCMELRKTCNHPLLNYPYFNDFSKDFLIRSCGKLWILDRILIKLQRTGHRVLLFSTMTKLLDILEEYLQWRRLVYRRIDGTTSLEDRESAIVDFNSYGSDCFIFLLSIRAAGRGLNLQSADTVIIYDPDPNPKNEEQAVARAHRIGQTREVKVIYMEAVVGKISSHQKEDELRTGGSLDLEDDLAGKDRYMGSIESLIRNNIQQYKIDMADEVINAGRFDQRTTHEERRMTLETLLHDEERYQETVHDVPSLQEVNRMIARSEDEVELFDQMDEELDWTEEMTSYDQVPKWLRASTRDVNAAIANLSKKPSKNILFASGMGMETNEMETERKRGRPKGKKFPNYKEVDDDNGEFSEASSDERNGYSANEEGDIPEFEDDESSGAVEAPPINKDQSEDDGPACDAGYEYSRASENTRNNQIVEQAGSAGSSSDNRRITRMVSPVSSQKFGSLSALDARPGSVRKLPDELEEGEIAVSGDSHMDHQQSGSWMHDRDEGEEEQVLQPKIKRKRSIRVRPRHTLEKTEEKSGIEAQRGDSGLLPFQMDHKYQSQLRTDAEMKTFGEPSASRHDQSDSSKGRRNFPSRRMANTSKVHASPKSSRLNIQSAPAEDAAELSRESWDGKVTTTNGNSLLGSKMSDIIHRRCKNVISKFQRRIDKEGQQIVPLLTALWKRTENSSYMSGAGNNLLDLRKIELRVDRLEYNGVMELVFDVQFMLKGTMQFYGFSHEVWLPFNKIKVRSEARKVHDLFFDILKIAFPDTDFREARNALSFSSTSSAPSPRQTTLGQGKRHRAINEVEPDNGTNLKQIQRGSIHTGDDTRVKVQLPKEIRHGSSREQGHPGDSPLHPGELVICKKKRKDRDKSMVKSRAGSSGPVSPPSMGRNITSPVPGSVSKDMRIAKQNSPQQRWANQPQLPNNGGISGGSGNVGWANPVKRLRTDAGKRRPSHL
ncbi:ATP-dependent helicase BRM isoform X6 [Manihot esculenta]|uniref:ATP-dependent helicase BRM isoform X6 n=1 Tax=Manihot esculenta TaxID=3983 RepID=UPI001CC7A6DD|nr:ATP-dependent helicase BRM isoform X6 [Manihot esculenta]